MIARYPIITRTDTCEEAKRVLTEMTLGKFGPRTIRWDGALEKYLNACRERKN
jgi:hypothetical protein